LFSDRLLKKAHLQRYAANLIAQRILYASRFGFGDALHLNLFEQPVKQGFSMPC